MKLDADMVLEVAHHEAVIRQAYKDSVGVWTWSIGITNASGHNVERYIDNPQTLERCFEVAIWLLEKQYLADVLKAFAPLKLNRWQLTAALSFHWNTGAIKRAQWVKDFKAGHPAKAYKNFMNYSKPASIIPRRAAERELFFAAKWANDGNTTEYQVTKAHTPSWKSAKRIDVRPIIEKILAPKEPEVTPMPPPAEPKAPPPKPRNWLAEFFTNLWKLLKGEN